MALQRAERADVRPLSRSDVREMHLMRDSGASPEWVARLSGHSIAAVRVALASEPEDWPDWTPVQRRPARRSGQTRGGPKPVPPVPAATARARDVRGLRADLRDDMAAGRVSLADVLLPKARPLIADRTLAELVRWQWAGSGLAAKPALEDFGRRAVGARVNVLAAAGRASLESRLWVAEHGTKWTRRRVEAA